MARIRLLGEARAMVGEVDAELERKSAACVALLAIEGRLARARVADLLWPNTEASASRGNLRQLARRLRLAIGSDVVASADPIEIDPGVTVDVRQLLACAAAGAWSRVVAFRGELLAGMEFDDCPEFSDWLNLTRMQLRSTLGHALSVEAARLESEQGPLAALPTALRWLELDPISEDAYRCLMRVHFANGDRGAALRVFADCRKALSQLDLEPSQETVLLARQIKGSQSFSPPLSATAARRSIPLSLLRPPLLAGRGQVLQKITDGLAAGKLTIITGPAGIGKTRLVQDFVAMQEGYALRYIACRPGDRELPYAYFARTWRHDLALYPERLNGLADWARAELARIMPELGPAPPPIVTAEQRLRFFDANLELAKANDTAVFVVSDDVHHLDPASHELGFHLGGYFIEKGSALRSISTFRPDELDPETLAFIRGAADADVACLVELAPLTPDELRQLLDGLGMSRLSGEVDRLHAFTGGIPFYIVETLKAGFEECELASLPLELTPSDRVRLTIERRLERLSAVALAILRAGAVLDEPLRFGVVRQLVGASSDVMSSAWNELERGLLLRDGVIAHELLRNVVVDSMPAPARAALHERVAGALAELRAHPARVAVHWLEAGNPARAAECFDAAAELARGVLRAGEASVFVARAETLRSRLRSS